MVPCQDGQSSAVYYVVVVVVTNSNDCHECNVRPRLDMILNIYFE